MRRHNITQLFDAPIFRNIEDKAVISCIMYMSSHTNYTSQPTWLSFVGSSRPTSVGHTMRWHWNTSWARCVAIWLFSAQKWPNTFQDVCQTHNYTIEWSCKTRKEIGCPTVQQHNYTTLQYNRVRMSCITYEWFLVRCRYRFYNKGFEIRVESVASCLLSCRQLFPRRLLRHFLHRRFKG